jgi:predicted nucleotidyltransferase
MARDPDSIEMVRAVVRHLGDLADDCVFLGGAITPLLITDPAAPASRATRDVDLIVDIGTRAEYTVLRKTLITKGFTEDTREGAPLCRWTVAGVTVDVMPISAAVLGFSNRWYPGALTSAVTCKLPGGPSIRLVTAPYFLATKLEAFLGRGQGDYQASHDLEDVVALIDGRPELADELFAAPADLAGFVSGTLNQLLATQAFRDALPGHLPPDAASQARLGLVLDRMRRLARGR